MQRPLRNIQLTVIALASLLSGCAATPGPSVTSTAETAFNDFLVLAIADNYNNRAQFERTVASNLKNEGADATAYYAAAGGNTPIDRDSVRAIMEAGAYDALLVTRVLAASSEAEIKSGSTAAKVTRRDGRPLDFFRYDYEELDEPAALQMNSEVSLTVELYRKRDSAQLWSTEITSKGTDNIGAMIDDIADKVVSRLSRDRRIAR